MKLKDIIRNKWTKFIFWALLYIAWVIWLGSYWWLLGLSVIFDIFITRKVRWNFWKKRYKEGEKHSAWNEWLDAIIFAVLVVSFINIFFFQAFKIPSSSMERTLYTGDHLFVSKLAYGPRVLETPLTIPFTHNTIFGKESYSTLIHQPYRRLKGFREVRKGDNVVFGVPNGDTVLRKAPVEDYHALVRFLGRDKVESLGEIVVRPVDKKDHYVKRCVGLPGQTLQIKEKVVYLDGKPNKEPDNVQYTYLVKMNGMSVVDFLSTQYDDLRKELGITNEDVQSLSRLHGFDVDSHYLLNDSLLQQFDGYMPLTKKAVAELKNRKIVSAIRPVTDRDLYSGPIYPMNAVTGWTRDNYGPVWIPKKGESIHLSMSNIAIYERPIKVYEGNDLEVKNGQIYINGKLADSYTFKMDYYWLMGDNRHNSADSRYWGFVPEDHVVGKPIFIWWSSDPDRSGFGGIRWSRLFNLVDNIK